MTRVNGSLVLLTILCTTLSSGSPLHAGEPNCAVCETGVPMLSKIPYLNRLFKNVGVEEDCAECIETAGAVEELPCPKGKGDAAVCLQPSTFRHVGADGLERIGVDFEFNGPCPMDACAAAVPQPIALVSHATLLEAYEGFAQEISGLREAFHEQQQELLGTLVESRIENAYLAAKLEFAAEREKLVVENALLKAKASPAPDEATELAQLRDENAALKAKLATMEERLASLEQPVKKSADKAATKRKR